MARKSLFALFPNHACAYSCSMLGTDNTGTRAAHAVVPTPLSASYPAARQLAPLAHAGGAFLFSLPPVRSSAVTRSDRAYQATLRASRTGGRVSHAGISKGKGCVAALNSSEAA